MKIETIKVFNPSGDGFMIINESDFKEDIHNLWVESAVEYEPVVSEKTEFDIQPQEEKQEAQQAKRGRPSFKR